MGVLFIYENSVVIFLIRWSYLLNMCIDLLSVEQRLLYVLPL
jgi:hypothetical protein